MTTITIVIQGAEDSMTAHDHADLVEHARASAGMIVCALDSQVVAGDLSPSSDTAAHAYVYRAMPEAEVTRQRKHDRRT